MILLREYHEAIEFDLLGLGLDLLDLYRGDLSARRLWVIIRQLPRDSAFRKALDPTGTAWGETEYLLAHVIDHLHAGNWQRGNINAEPRDRAPFPEPFPRPGMIDAAEEQQKAAAEMLAAERAYRAAKGLTDGG